MTHPKLTFAAQGVAGALLLLAAGMKFMGAPGSVLVFASLEMEPTGRYLIGAIELFAALLLLSPSAAVGSLIAVSVMCGAILAHVTQLGLVVDGDGGRLVGMLVAVLASASFVLVSRRRELPLVGRTL